jgi:hypothetical protein
MEQQDPRLTAERMVRRSTDGTIGRSTDQTIGLERTESLPSGGDDRRTREIRADIEQTREDLSETVSAIQEHLRPANIAANATDRIKTAAATTARDAARSEPVQYVRSNPVPAAMVGIGLAGLAWLTLGGRNGGTTRRRTTPDYDRYRTYPAASTLDSPPHLSGSTSFGNDELDAPYTYGSDRSSGYGGERRRRVQNQLTRRWNESPLLVGAAAMIAGAIVGLSVPETERENQMLGEARDNMVENIRGTVERKVTEVQEAATDAVNRVQQVAKNAVGMPTGENS